MSLITSTRTAQAGTTDPVTQAPALPPVVAAICSHLKDETNRILVQLNNLHAGCDLRPLPRKAPHLTVSGAFTRWWLLHLLGSGNEMIVVMHDNCGNHPLGSDFERDCRLAKLTLTPFVNGSRPLTATAYRWSDGRLELLFGLSAGSKTLFSPPPAAPRAKLKIF